jgi:hypothetical protein
LSLPVPSPEGILRIAATLLITILVAACQTPVAPAPASVSPGPVVVLSPSAVAVVSPGPLVVVSPSPLVVVSPSAEPSPTADDALVTVALPVKACPTSTGGVETPPTPPATWETSLPASLANRIGVYGDGYDLVLGPVGWTCEAQVGADGSTSIRVWAPGDEAAQVTSETNGGCFGCGLMLACSTFAVASEQFAVDFGLCDPQRPTEERVTAESAEIIAFVDPPGVAGTGTGSGGAYEASGLVWFSYDGETVFASKSTCTLAPADAALCAPILDQARALLPAPPAGSQPAGIVPLVPPAG